jgi:hypothetical protein
MGIHRSTNSLVTGGEGANGMSKDRFQRWWDSFVAYINFSRRLRNAMRVVPGLQPDFPAPLGMDGGPLDREAQRGHAGGGRKNGSTPSTDRFPGGLDSELADPELADPFGDANAFTRHGAKPGPLIVPRPDDPASDGNTISTRSTTTPAPTTYVADPRRSRGRSLGGNSSPAPSTLYRDSVGSVASFASRRNKFRSDPFDLERPELLANNASQAKAGPGNSNAVGSRRPPEQLGGTAAGGAGSRVSRPAGAHIRSASLSSEYGSCFSVGNWSDPGSDVGPAASRRDGPDRGRNRQERDTALRTARATRSSDGSQITVGLAM